MIPKPASAMDRERIETTALLHWEEHCHECAMPVCYETCSLYVPRADKKCARFAYGIYPNSSMNGLFDFGADIRFRRWAKLESRLYGKSLSVRHHRRLDRVNRFAFGAPKNASSTGFAGAMLPVLGTSAVANQKTFLAKVRNKYFTKIAAAGKQVAYDDFVLECFSPEEASFRIILEYFNLEIKARHAFRIDPGWNLYTLPANRFQSGSEPPRGKITISPDDDAEKRLVFTWLDLVKYRPGWRPSVRQPKRTAAPAAKVKCVAWDLDNTIWKGILAEDTEANLTPRPEALDLLKKLDERGIIQTIVSKNNYQDAWPVIERLGLQDYFLYPAVNWQPKSGNLKEIAERLNINVDTFALIDDSPFERAEVETMLPQVRVYAETQIVGLLDREEFDVPVTESARKRRVSYLTEIKRERERESFGGDYETFLRSCQMKLKLFVPREEKHILRCLELIQRANQLNLSNARYTDEEFRSLLRKPEMLCLAMDCEDRFGSYGIVGFVSVEESARPTLLDFVLSCRVAQKRVEHALLEWLATREHANPGVAARVVRTERNHPIVQVFEDLGFRPAGESQGGVLLALPPGALPPLKGIVTVEADSSLEREAA